MNSKLLIYMPALNEAQTILKVIQSIPKTIEGYDTIEILVIDDGSSDITVLEAEKGNAIVISHKKNKGVGEAFQTALNYALDSKTDTLVSIDADGQFDVNQIPELVKPITLQKADFCIGVRFSEGRPNNMPKIKYWGNKQINKIVSYISNTKIQDASCGFRAYSKNTLLSMNLHGSFTYTHETILDLLDKGFVVAQIPITVQYFDDRVSRVANNIFKYGVKTSKIIIKSFKDYKPLYFFLAIAFCVFSFASIFGGWALVHWIIYGTITPYKSFGILGLALMGMSAIICIFAFMADSLGRLRKNQEKILFLLKKSQFENTNR